MQDRAENTGQNDAAARGRRSLVVSMIVLIGVMLTGLHLTWGTVDQRFLNTRAVYNLTALDTSMRAHLLAGLPLSDFAGFERIASTMIQAAPEIRYIGIRDPDGSLVMGGDPDDTAARFPDMNGAEALELSDGRSLLIQTSRHAIRLLMPLHGKIQQEGSLELVLSRDLFSTYDPAYFGSLYVIMSMAVILFAIFIYGIATDGEVARWRRSGRFLAGLFSLLAAVSVVFLVIMGESRSTDTARAIVSSFAARIDQAVSLGIDPADLSGLGDIVAEMRDSDRIIAFVALIEGKDVSTAAGLDGNADLAWIQASALTAIHELRPRQIYNRQYQVAVGLDAGELLKIGLGQLLPLLLSFLILPCLILYRRRTRRGG